MGWVRDVGGGVCWVGRCVSGVGIVLGKLWMYPHSATPRIPTQSPYNTKSSPPTAYAWLARSHFHHLAQTHTHHTYPTIHPSHPTPLPNQLCSNQPDPTISKTVHTLSHKQTHPTPSQPDPLLHLNPTQLPNHTHPIYYRTLQTLTPPTPICPPRRKDSHQS